jgi:hypothetical protein
VLHGLGDEPSVLHERLVLLGDGELDEVVLALDGEQHVHLGGLGGHDLGLEALLGKVQLDACVEREAVRVGV